MGRYKLWSTSGSIIGPLLFNIYVNDIFYFINEESIANYADDNTVYAYKQSNRQ